MGIKQSYDTVILDSGVDCLHPALCGFSDIDCAALDPQTGALIPAQGDMVGHATAIAGIIKKAQPQASILSIRIFELRDGEPVATEEQLLQALNYIERRLSVSVINMSFDVAEPTQLGELRAVTKKLADRDVILVAALKNRGGLTFPAAFEWVIGVSMDNLRSLRLPFAYNEDSIINIVSSPVAQRVAWKAGTYKNVRGSSFACAKISAEALSFIQAGYAGIGEILRCFEKKYPSGEKTTDAICRTTHEKPAFTIRKAALFPFNKEMHSVVRFADELPFEIVGVYDLRESFHVSKTTNDVLKQDLAKNYVIRNVDKIDWDCFDTLILGCIAELLKLFRRADWIKTIVDDALAHSKNIFAFEDISWLTDNAEQVYFPLITKENAPVYRENRLFRTAVPIIGVFGTDSQQGKFTIQLLLRKAFRKLDCVVGQIGTEPNALLFGMDYVYASGYNAVIELDTTQQTLYVNDLLRRTCEKMPDVIITGTQKGLVPTSFDNMNFYSQQNYAFLDGMKPDFAVLTVSISDTPELIRRNIAFLSVLSGTQTLALVLFPVNRAVDAQENRVDSRIVSREEYEAFRDKIRAEIDIPVLFLNDDRLEEQLMDVILAQIAGEEDKK